MYSRYILNRSNTLPNQNDWENVWSVLKKAFDEVWKSYKKDVKTARHWEESKDPPAISEFASSVIAKAKSNSRKKLNWSAAGGAISADNTLVGTIVAQAVANMANGAGAAVNTVYVRQDGTDKEFVQDAYHQLVPRYVYRVLNNDDCNKFDKEQDLAPRGPKSKANLLQHIGGKDSNYISTSRSSGEIQNSHGEAFGIRNKARVRAKIDLSMIPSDRIYDMSTADSELKLKGLNNSAQKSVNAMTAQVEVALWDAKRTKEVLIEGGIPYGAIVETEQLVTP